MLEPEISMDTKEPSSKVQVADIVKKARSGSVPGPNGVHYKVYKKFLTVLKYLWGLLKVVWKKEKCTIMLAASIGLFYPKRGKVREYHPVHDDTTNCGWGRYFSQF